MALQKLNFDQDKDAIIARLTLQRIDAFLACGYRDDLFSDNEATVINKFAIKSDKERYSTAMKFIDSRHYINSHATTATDPLTLPDCAEAAPATCDAVAVSCD
ncbi:hypothetical protein OTK49_21280 [Vibrio coralliirubri]|uniref:hypothetical protein n=1 Tax=Vibrio coralliirubri TaxID=1516159 RepID=UPI002284B2AF|nr:hypothetical protein [Vibrio coralliirubri]MCY9865054.1 hypothetical protein [Vibrio coralliirubri]